MTDNDMIDGDMTDHEPTRASRRKKGLAGAVGLLLAGGIAGGALVATDSASASGTPTSTAAPSSQPAAAGPRAPADTATPVRAGEHAQGRTELATLIANSDKVIPGGAVIMVETDADGAA